MKALVFDCDGVLVDTERDGHRIAFNRAFAELGVDAEWDVARYAELLKIAGGKERMRHYFDGRGWPTGSDDRDEFIGRLHKTKTDLFMRIVESGQLPLRSGVQRLIDEAIDAGVALAVCSTSNERAVNLILEKMLGTERKTKFSAILAGDVISKKKPDPEIYELVKQRLGVRGEEVVVVEDSRNGLLAATGAGMHCLVTTTAYTAEEGFAEADRVVAELGDAPDGVTLESLRQMTAG